MKLSTALLSPLLIHSSNFDTWSRSVFIACKENKLTWHTLKLWIEGILTLQLLRNICLKEFCSPFDLSLHLKALLQTLMVCSVISLMTRLLRISAKSKVVSSLIMLSSWGLWLVIKSMSSWAITELPPVPSAVIVPVRWSATSLSPVK